MKTLALAAVAILAIGAGSAFAEGEGPSDGGVSRPATQFRPQNEVARDAAVSRIYRVQSQMHDAWQNNGLNGGGG